MNLGKQFHYAGKQLLPGVWHGDTEEIQYGFVDTPYTGNLPLKDIAKKLKNIQFQKFNKILSEFVNELIINKIIIHNIVIERILSDLDVIESVEDMAASANLSTWQLQRIVRDSTGLRYADFNVCG